MQSEAMCPAPPHLVQTVVLVMLRVSLLCQGRRILPRDGDRVSGVQGMILGHGGGVWGRR